MSTLTDPARELADLCAQLAKATPNNERGDTVLARTFGVAAWSAEFYQIIFTISVRIKDLIAIIGELEMDADIRAGAVSHLEQIRRAFSQEGLQNQWAHSVTNFISPANVHPILMLSSQVRTKYAWLKLNDGELKELMGQTDELIQWLSEHQLRELDFIRQALLDGLTQFRFRIERLQWLGWGYTLQSLRDVIGAYMALERGSPDLNAAPDAGAALMKTKALVSSIFEKLKVAKEVTEMSDFILRAYGLVTLATQGAASITALLTHG